MTAPTADQIYRIEETKKITGLSRSSIYRLVSEGKFPPGVKLGSRATGWRHSDLMRWIDSRTTSAK